MLRVGLVGYGTGGQHFHAPFIVAAEGCRLVGVVARAPATIEKVRADLPDVPVYPSLAAMIAAGGLDAVTITTPPETRRVLVLEAISAGLHVIADKPFAPDAEGGRLLERAAKAAGVALGVYQNRRYDADLQTLAKVIRDGRLGRIWRIESRMDQDSPQTLEHGPAGGLLRDLGSHLVDQMVYLLGPVASVDAQLDFVELPKGLTDASFSITLRHRNGSHSHLSASKLNHVDVRELRAYGDKGAYIASSTDVQAQAIFADKRPVDDPTGWGYEPSSHWGRLHAADGVHVVPSEQGRYHDYYTAFACAIAEGAEPPVTPASGVQTLQILDAARQSAAEGHSILL
jgi:predicted dehydrogenase